MKYHLRKSPEHPESRFLVTREEIEDQLKTGQIDHTWQARAEGESQWQGVSAPAAPTAPPTPPPSSTGKSLLVALVVIGGFIAVGSILSSGDLSSLLSSTTGTMFQSREDIAREALASRIGRESGGLIRLVAFEKTNGMEHPVMGNALYQIEYTATVEAVEDCLWTLGGRMWDGTFAATRGKPRGGIEAFNPQVFGKNPATKGLQQRVKGELVLQKTEKGWRAAQ
jgi:hypothetical protein